MIFRLFIFAAVAAVIFFSVFNLVKWYFKKIENKVNGDPENLMDSINSNKEERKQLARQVSEAEKEAKNAVKKYGKIKKSI